MERKRMGIREPGHEDGDVQPFFLYGVVRHRHLDEELFNLRNKGGTKRETQHG